MNRHDTVIYVPVVEGIDADERWDIVSASLRSAGFTNIQPAPLPAQRFQPRHARQPMPILISRAEV